MYDIFIVGVFSRLDEFKKKFPFVKSAKDLLEAQRKSLTSSFWAITEDVAILDSFLFDFKVPEWDQKYIHVFKKSNNEFRGVYIVPKDYTLTKREIEYSFFVNKKEIDIVYGKDQLFDIVFISYDEPNADENWGNLKKRFSYAKRVHGVTGIHNAHIAAAELSNSDMIWVVDGDAVILDDFKFDIEIPKWDRNITHVCKSKNPINGLEYGYGGVKLLPRKLLLNIKIDTVDMTTSISKDFKSFDTVSNVTKFNTDPFNTWKSAFRECVKLASKVIDGQIDTETQQRLDVWCTVGQDQPNGKWALIGAQAGRDYGLQNTENKEMLLKINDWKWLQDEFNKL